MISYTLADRQAILREMTGRPSDVAKEIAQLRGMRERATILHEQITGSPTLFGLGLRTGAGVILGRVPMPEAWIAPLVAGGVQDALPVVGTPRHRQAVRKVRLAQWWESLTVGSAERSG